MTDRLPRLRINPDPPAVDRKLNYLMSFLVLGVFIFSADASQHRNLALGLLLAGFFSFGAFLLRQITLDGMFAATVIGTITFGLGGIGAAFLILLFFITGAVLSYQKPARAEELPIEIRRNGLQVWANGFWFVILLIFNDIFLTRIYLVGAAAAVAAATADTWATELGSRKKSATYMITNFTHVAPGTDGGISIKGTMAALTGSALIAIMSIYVFSLQLHDFLYIFIGGFSGCLIDSYLGALFQRNNRTIGGPAFLFNILIDNNVVNGMATGAGALLAIILKLVFT